MLYTKNNKYLPCKNNLFQGDTSELEDRQEQTREKVLECLMTVSQILRLLCSKRSPVPADDIYLAHPNQCHNAYGGPEDQEYISTEDDVSLVDLGDDDTRCLVASSQNQKDQENTSLQYLTESSEGSDDNEGLTLNAYDCPTVEGSAFNREEESMHRADLCEILEGKRLFEEDRKLRRSFVTDLQERARKKQLNSEKGDSIQSHRASVNYVSKLQSSQNGSNCSNLEVPHQNLEAQAPSENPTFTNVRTHENAQRISSHEDSTAKEEDKLMRVHQLPQGPALNNVKDRNDLDMEPKCELPEDVSSRLPKTTLVKEYRFTAFNESDSSSILERGTYAKNVETTRNDVCSSEQNAIKTNRETTPNQEVQGTIGVDQEDQEGQRQTKPTGNKFISRKQHHEEESERNEVEIRENRGNTPEKQETPCVDYDDKATEKTLGPLAGDVLPHESMDKDASATQKNVVDLLRETGAVDGLNLKVENGIHSVKKREPTYPYGQIHSKSRATISNRNKRTTRPLCQGGDVVADGESHEDLNKNTIAVDGSALAKSHLKDSHAFLESGLEIIGNITNTPKKDGTSCPDYDEMTTERTFEPPIEDVLPDGTTKEDTSRSQNNLVDLLRETDAVDGPTLKEENETRSLKQKLRALEKIDPHEQIHFVSQAILSNRHETSFRSMRHGGDVVADGESREDSIYNVDTVDGPVLTQNLHKDFHAGERSKSSVKHKRAQTLGSEKESHTDREGLCKSRYPLEHKGNLSQFHSGDGGARPKQRSTDNAKTPLPWPSIKYPMSADSDLERINLGLDPVFLARHVKESNPLLPFHNGGNYNYASSDGLWKEDHELKYFSPNAYHQAFYGKDQKSHDKEEFIPRDKADRYDKVTPVYNALAPLAPPNGKQKESWHFPLSESCKDTVLRSQCFAEMTNESNPTSLPKSFDANREKLFSECGSACAYNDMDSMANDYSIGVGGDECGKSPPISKNDHSRTENSLSSNLRYLQEIMTKTIRLVALNATGARENDAANQTVEKTGIREETGDMGEAEVTQRLHETNTPGESTPLNETTVEAERQPMVTPVQESPRPVCSHYQRRCLVRFPCCGKFFPCHRCHNESDCSEDQARAVNATHIRCTICYHEQEVKFLFMILCLAFMLR